MDTLDLELEQLTAPAITCRRCGTPFPQHGDGGGPVTVRAGSWGGSPMGVPILCAGFLWVDPATPPGGYSAPPSPAFGG